MHIPDQVKCCAWKCLALCSVSTQLFQHIELMLSILHAEVHLRLRA